MIVLSLHDGRIVLINKTIKFLFQIRRAVDYNYLRRKLSTCDVFQIFYRNNTEQ